MKNATGLGDVLQDRISRKDTTRRHVVKLQDIEPCPYAGAGVHVWIMRSAWRCRFNKWDASTAVDAIAGRMSRPPGPANEIETAVSKVYSEPLRPQGASFVPRKKAWPSLDYKTLGRLSSEGIGLADLYDASPKKFGDAPEAAVVLPQLFPGDPLICYGSKKEFWTNPLSLFLESAHNIEQIVPSPMTAKWGKTQGGKISQRTLDATGPRRFIVVEGDKIDGRAIPKDVQAAVLIYLSKFAPLALVVDSGGKSLHGWFFCEGVEEGRVRKFFSRAVSLGADSALWTRSQFVRMPDGTRDNGKRQSILFFNPKAITQ